MRLIERECVIFNIKEREKNSVISKMVQALKECGKLNDDEIFLQDVFDREALSATSMGFDIGIPHGKSDEVISPAVCFGRLQEPVIWNDETGETAQIIILIAVPKNDESNLHLKILSNLARKLMHEDFRNTLLNENEDCIYELMKKELGV